MPTLGEIVLVFNGRISPLMEIVEGRGLAAQEVADRGECLLSAWALGDGARLVDVTHEIETAAEQHRWDCEAQRREDVSLRRMQRP